MAEAKTDDFETAFAQFSAPEPKSEDPPAAEPKSEDPPAEDPPADEPKSEDPPAEDPPAEDSPAAQGPSADDILAGLKKLVGEQKSEPKQPEDKVDDKQPEDKPVYSEEEQAFLTEYDKDWSDVARGEGLKRRAEYQQLLQYVFQQVAEYVKPFREMTEALAERTHVADVTGAVPDYSDQLREDVVKWVEQQPAYLQPAYNHVITQGTVEEVKDLVDRYRAATGKTAPAATQKPAGKKDNELSDEAKKAAASLAPVESKRSGVQQPSDPSNFDDAWAQFAKPDSV